MMPGMDGIELCAKIKGTFEYCHIPVILLTAKNTDDSRIEGYDSGLTVMLPSRSTSSCSMHRS